MSARIEIEFASGAIKTIPLENIGQGKTILDALSSGKLVAIHGSDGSVAINPAHVVFVRVIP